MLHAIAELAQHAVRNVERILRDKIHAHAFGAHQAHDLLDFLQQRVRRIVEQQVRFIEKEHQLGFFRVAHFRQLLEQFRQQP